MKYAYSRDFVPHREVPVSGVKSAYALCEKVKELLRLLLAKRIDPTRMSRVERQDSGISDAEIDLHNALHGPLIK